MQAIFGDMASSRKHIEKLDEVFIGEQSDIVLDRVLLVIDNFDKLAAHCKQVSSPDFTTSVQQQVTST